MDKAIERYANIKDTMKGISPVIAVILMVMITVALVAFSYSWLQKTMSESQGQTSKIISGQEEMSQRLEIATAYQCGANICFELRAASTNSRSLNMNGTGYYIRDVPKTSIAWDGGVGGLACSNTVTLAAGQKCYGMIENTQCAVGDSLKVSTGSGATDTKGLTTGCS